jgi:hypothetical protein
MRLHKLAVCSFAALVLSSPLAVAQASRPKHQVDVPYVPTTEVPSKVFDDEGSCWNDAASRYADSRENDGSRSMRFDRPNSDRGSRIHRTSREPLNMRISTHSPIPHWRSP